jgi:hypothetical protein
MGLFQVPRKIIAMKLKEFIEECQNDQALSYFLNKVLGAKLAQNHTMENGVKVLLVVLDGESLSNSRIFTPQELIDEILNTHEELDLVRENVLFVKSNFDYKKPISLLNEQES